MLVPHADVHSTKRRGPRTGESSGVRILVVEDEERLAAVLAKGLAEHGYAVDTAHDGDDGLQLALIEPYDLVILDLMLPSTDGLAVCKAAPQAGADCPGPDADRPRHRRRSRAWARQRS